MKAFRWEIFKKGAGDSLMNETDLNKFMDILNSREERAKKQVELLNMYPYTLISFTLNIPGINKNSDIYSSIHDNGMFSLVNALNTGKIEIKNIEFFRKSTGNEGFISVNSDPISVKILTTGIENEHPLGRIFDIDVFDKDHNQLSRTDLGLEPRKCLMCGKEARICIREKNHTYEELIERIEQICRDFFDNR